MAPTRVGILGLSKTGWAPGAHLPYLKASDEYEIVAICNSSVKSAEEAIKTYELPESTKAYGNPNDLAADKNVDLVVCAVRVDRHVATMMPALKAGKDVFVEWPLGASLKDAETLLALKNAHNVKRTTVGLQARQAPIVKTLHSLVASSRIGRVLSSTWTSQAGLATLTPGTEYLLQKEVGGNILTIHFGHSVDYVQQVLGYGFSVEKSILATRKPQETLLDSNGKTVLEEKHAVTADDTIAFTGILSHSGIVVSMNLRRGKPFPGTPGLDWRITGEKGEIRLTTAGPFLQIGYPEMKVEVCDFSTEKVEIVQVPTDQFDEFGLPARNVARLYEAFAKGEDEYLCSFEDAVERHKLIDRMYVENGWQGYH